MQSVGQRRCGWWWRRGGEDQQRGGTVAAAAELFWCQWPVCPRHRSHHRPATRRPATPSLPLVRTPALLTDRQGAQLCTKKQPLNELFLPLIIFFSRLTKESYVHLHI